ncbi:PHD finger At1g33420 [Olea europaea subsp. europaea]|uniref:PHD finger At1g33420 n=2 Tax=Olea europaea subsp. europaea TaxID=158383 RepID=A0A8S0RIQ0_OLEEU|nr:PHD finger At1g33420 [Olea europaea subsp. europaea]
MVVNGRPMKRVKRRVTADLSDFLTFPIGGEVAPRGPFRTSVKKFLQKNALLPPPSSLFPHLLTWQVLFRVGNTVDDDGGPSVLFLDVVEEDVARSRSVYCDQCRVVGWSSNPVSAKRYHFIIKADGNSIGGYNKTCAGCGDSLHMADSRCKTCNHMMTTEDVEDWMYHQLEDTTHLLHGVVHANGYGHLLRVNGREGGSKLLSGHHIMSFWDRLCTTLGVRKISVMDVSKKHGLELRLLNAITRGHPWYGDWGYEFGAGSFSLSHDAYKMAIKDLSSLPLSIFQSQGRKPRTILQDLISFYQSLSERELVNIRDLFCFLTSLIHDVQNSYLKVDYPPSKKRCSGDSRVLCAWTINDVARIEEAMIKVLRAVSGSTWVSWRALRGAVCKLGPPELLDYCLRELKGKQTAEGMFVNSRCISDSGAMEYRLEPGSMAMDINSTSNSPMRNYPSKEHLLRDLKYLYACMLHPESMKIHFPPLKRDLAVISATAILDCKQFVKDYNPEKLLLGSRPNVIQLLCEVDLTEQFEEHGPNPPPEILTLPLDATIADLKREAMKAFQEAYVMFRRFQAEELIGYGGVDESTQVKLLLGSIEFVRIRGRFLGKNSFCRFKTERGLERWTVDCCCGAQDDDGERMLACDVCGVWQHTRCCGIPDSEAVPAKFFCNRCRGGLKTSGHSKDEMVDSVFKSVTNRI